MGAAAIIIIIAAALLATVSVRAGWYLTLRGGENGETCVRYRLDEGDWFCVGFIHSVHKNPLIDCYQIQEHKIYVEQTYYYSFGAGVTEPAERRGVHDIGRGRLHCSEQYPQGF